MGNKKCSCDRDMLGALIAGLLLGLVIGLASITLFFAQTWALGAIAIGLCVVLYLVLVSMKRPDGLSHQIQAISAFFGVCVSAIAVVVAYSAFKGVEESSAKGMYKEYLNLALVNEDFAKPSKVIENKYPDNIPLGKRVSYEFFVGNLLFTAEEILSISKLESWDSLIGLQICYHIGHLSEYEFKDKETKGGIKFNPLYTEELNDLVKLVHSKTIGAKKVDYDCDAIAQKGGFSEW